MGAKDTAMIASKCVEETKRKKIPVLSPTAKNIIIIVLFPC